jgi:hypothetical protein
MFTLMRKGERWNDFEVSQQCMFCSQTFIINQVMPTSLQTSKHASLKCRNMHHHWEKEKKKKKETGWVFPKIAESRSYQTGSDV